MLVQNWFANNRKRSKNILLSGRKPAKLFNRTDLNILENYFLNSSEKPSPAELDTLSKILNKDTHKIRKWFYQRKLYRTHS
jgi:hypothetical protein